MFPALYLAVSGLAVGEEFYALKPLSTGAGVAYFAKGDRYVKVALQQAACMKLK